jgi:hypothetical protein
MEIQDSVEGLRGQDHLSAAQLWGQKSLGTEKMQPDLY